MTARTKAVVYYDAAESAICIADLSPGGIIKKISADASLISRGEYPSAFAAALQAVPKRGAPLSVDFVLPHGMYGIDYITLPLIKRSQLGEAFKTELRSQYKNYDALSFTHTEVYIGKTSTTFCVAMAQKQLLAELKEVFARSNITIERFLPYGSVLLAGAIRMKPAMKKAPCLLLHVEDKHAYIAAYGKETLLGGISIPFGAEALSDSHVASERLLYHPDSAELLVINAKERAKATKLTMAINIEEEKIDDGVLSDESEEGLESNPALPDLTRVGREQAAEDEDDSEVPPEMKIKTLRKSAVRSLPKFMLREAPVTPQGFVLENFRLFERRLLLTAREMSLAEYIPRPEAIFLSLPARSTFLAEAMAAQNPEFKWFSLADTLKTPNKLMLYGVGGFTSGKLPVFL